MRDLPATLAKKAKLGSSALSKLTSCFSLIYLLLSWEAVAQEQTVLFDFGRHNGRDGSVVSTTPLLLFYASDWAGPNNTWYSRTGTENLFYDTFGGSAPQKGSSTIAGVAVDTAVFDGNDFLTSTFVTGRPWAGLKQFSLSLVFKSNSPGPQTQTNIDAFYNQRGILGFELGGGGSGEFAIGLYNDGSPSGAVAASTGLGIGDNGSSAGNINDNNWHTLTMVVKDEGSGFFSQSVYVDGSLLNSSSLLQYGTVGILADASFSLGSIRGSASTEKFVGEVAALRFDDTPLAASDVTTLHNTYLGIRPTPTFADSYRGKEMLGIAPNGLTYLANYAFGGSDTSEPKLPVQDTSDSNQLALVAYVRTGDVSVGGQDAPSLDFSSASTTSYVVINPSDAPTGMEKRRYSVDINGNRRFLRLIITKQ